MEQFKCPNCGSDHVEQTADHCSDGYNGYKCNDCGCTFGDQATAYNSEQTILKHRLFAERYIQFISLPVWAGNNSRQTISATYYYIQFGMEPLVNAERLPV